MFDNNFLMNNAHLVLFEDLLFSKISFYVMLFLYISSFFMLCIDLSCCVG